MNNLKLNYKEITKLINLKTNDWKNIYTTNCYSFALGLDVNYSEISEHAYILGCFSEDYLNNNSIRIESLSDIEKLKYDLDVLGLKYTEVDPFYQIEENNRISFLISFFEGNNDFHFMRKNNYNNFWYHKRGWTGYPNCYDDFGKIIDDPKKAFLIDYSYVKTYRIDNTRGR